MEDKAFWIVWREPDDTPSHWKNTPITKHHDFGAAADEAERLARANPGARFHLLAQYGSVKTEVQPVKWTYPQA